MISSTLSYLFNFILRYTVDKRFSIMVGLNCMEGVWFTLVVCGGIGEGG